MSLSFKELNENLLSVCQTYLQHKYQVYNDKYHWDYILRNQQYGDIFHFDFSENITQILKNEPQSDYFGKDTAERNKTAANVLNIRINKRY